MKSGSLVLKSRDFLAFILVSYAIVVSLFVDAGLRNYFVLFAAILGGFLFCVFGFTLKRQVLWVLILIFIMTMRTLFLDEADGLGSVALTFVYSLGYVAISSMLDRVQDRRTFVQDMMRWIIYAFGILSVIQMGASLTGLPIPNEIATKGHWSYNSLAFEPSQLGRVVGLSMLCYLMLTRLPAAPNHVSDPPITRLKVLIAFLVTMLLSGSALSAVAIPFVFLLSRSLVGAGVLMTVTFLIWPLALQIDYEPLQRVSLLLSNLETLDIASILEADHSGALRIVPSLVYAEAASPAELEFWFGYGPEGLERFLLGKIQGIGDTIAAGFIPGFLIVNGLIVTTMFVWVFTIRILNRSTAPLVGFWLIFITSSPWNIQVFWYGLIIIQITYAASYQNALRIRSERS